MQRNHESGRYSSPKFWAMMGLFWLNRSAPTWLLNPSWSMGTAAIRALRTLEARAAHDHPIILTCFAQQFSLPRKRSAS